MSPNKKRKLSAKHSQPISPAHSEAEENDGLNGGEDDWDDEQDYELRPRKLKSNGSNKLPIKTDEGWIQQETMGQSDEEGSDSISDTDQGNSHADNHGVEQESMEEDEDGEEKTPKISQRQQILQAKEELARLAGLVNEDPEEHISALRALAQFTKSSNITIKQLSIATQCAVYKDIIPGYRIRPISDEDKKEKISKEVKKLRNYEQSMVKGYQAYIRQLESLSTASKDSSESGSEASISTAVSCACNLLLAVPHFNFRGDLLKIIIKRLGRKSSQSDYDRCLQTLETLFKSDEDGRPSLEAVTMLTKMIKAKSYRVHESLLNVFLHLRLLSEFTSKASWDQVDKDHDDQPELKSKSVKEKRQFRTKKERKLIKERKVVEKDMQEADAVVGHEERDRMQAEMLKLVFVTYFRILKAKTPHLMGAVLEGLARYAHLINQNFFGDILEALKDLINDAKKIEQEEEDSSEHDLTRRNITREFLLCIVTAFALLQGQDASAAASSLHLDLNFFITNLYQILHPTCMDANIELSSKSLHLPDPGSSNPSERPNVNAKTTTVLLLRALSSTLLPPTAVRSVPPLRLAAFTKKLLTVSLNLPEKSCTAMLGLLAQVTKIHGRKIAGLWNADERRGDGVFDALSVEVESSNPFASTAWEGELLRLHFAPNVREAVKTVNGNIRAVGS